MFLSSSAYVVAILHNERDRREYFPESRRAMGLSSGLGSPRHYDGPLPKSGGFITSAVARPAHRLMDGSNTAQLSTPFAGLEAGRGLLRVRLSVGNFLMVA